MMTKSLDSHTGKDYKQYRPGLVEEVFQNTPRSRTGSKINSKGTGKSWDFWTCLLPGFFVQGVPLQTLKMASEELIH